MAGFTKSAWNVCNDPLEVECVRLPQSLRRRLRVLAQQRGASVADVVRDLLSRAADDAERKRAAADAA